MKISGKFLTGMFVSLYAFVIYLYIASVDIRIIKGAIRNMWYYDKVADVCLGDQECIRFHDLLSKWPPEKPKAAIYILVNTARVLNIYEILSQLDKHFNDVFNYPVILFHENMTNILRLGIRNSTNSDIFFQTVTFRLPPFLKGKVPVKISCRSRISYRHMCRFHSKAVYEYPIMQKLGYAWRLDDDSEILGNISYDVFLFMQNGGYLYGYIHSQGDMPRCTTGLWNTAKAFILRNNITPTFFNDWPPNKIYYNNFEISAVSLWLSGGYRQYIEHIDSVGGIFFHRWGDAPIKTIAVTICVPSNKVYKFTDIWYKHQGLRTKPK